MPVSRPELYPPWWTAWFVDGHDLDSVEGYLLACDFEDDGRPIAYHVRDLKPGDPDPRDPAWCIQRIDSIVDTDDLPIYPYLHLHPADGSEPPARHRFDWAGSYPLVIRDLDGVIEMVHITYGNNLPINFRAEVSIREA